MSDTSQGPGWWLASDGRWYPPELWTGPPGTRPDAGAASSIPSTDPSVPTYPSSTSGDMPSGATPQSAYPDQPPAYPQQGYGTGTPSVDPGAGYGSQYAQPGPYGAAPYGSAPYAAGQYGVGQYAQGQYSPGQYGQYAGYGTPARKTNGLAVASLVCGIGGFLFFIPLVLAIVFGFVARSQIRKSNGTQGGQGLATAGIILGFAWVAFFIIVFIASALTTNDNSGVVLAHLVSLGGQGG